MRKEHQNRALPYELAKKVYFEAQAKDIPVHNPLTAHITKQNYERGMLSMSEEILCMILGYLVPYDGKEGLPMEIVLDIEAQYPPKEVLACNLVCRDFHRIMHTELLKDRTQLIRNLPRQFAPLGTEDGMDIIEVNVLEQQTRLLCPTMQNSITQIIFAWENLLGDETVESQMEYQFRQFMPCIKHLPNLKIITVVDVGREIWSSEFNFKMIEMDYEQFQAAIDCYVTRMTDLTFDSDKVTTHRYQGKMAHSGNDKWSVTWKGQTTKPREIAVVGGKYIRILDKIHLLGHKFARSLPELWKLEGEYVAELNGPQHLKIMAHTAKYQDIWYKKIGTIPADSYDPSEMWSEDDHCHYDEDECCYYDEEE